MMENVKIQYLYIIENQSKTRNLNLLGPEECISRLLNGRYHIKVTVLNLVLLKAVDLMY